MNCHRDNKRLLWRRISYVSSVFSIKLYNSSNTLVGTKITNSSGFAQFTSVTPDYLTLQTSKVPYLSNRKSISEVYTNITETIVLKDQDLHIDIEGVFQNPKEADPTLTNDSEYPISSNVADVIVDMLTNKYLQFDPPSDKTEDDKHNLE